LAAACLLSGCAGRTYVDPLPDLEGAELQPIRLHIGADGAILWASEEVTQEELVRRLALEAEKDPQPAVIIGADPGTPFASFAPVIEDVEKSGMLRMGIAARPAP
jgi:biopolymer transport protein ExbD